MFLNSALLPVALTAASQMTPKSSGTPLVLALIHLFSCYAFLTLFENLPNEGARATSLRLARNLTPVQ